MKGKAIAPQALAFMTKCIANGRGSLERMKSWADERPRTFNVWSKVFPV
jgi:hypothetical protein